MNINSANNDYVIYKKQLDYLSKFAHLKNRSLEKSVDHICDILKIDSSSIMPRTACSTASSTSETARSLFTLKKAEELWQDLNKKKDTLEVTIKLPEGSRRENPISGETSLSSTRIPAVGISSVQLSPSQCPEQFDVTELHVLQWIVVDFMRKLNFANLNVKDEFSKKYQLVYGGATKYNFVFAYVVVTDIDWPRINVTLSRFKLNKTTGEECFDNDASVNVSSTMIPKLIVKEEDVSKIISIQKKVYKDLSFLWKRLKGDRESTESTEIDTTAHSSSTFSEIPTEYNEDAQNTSNE